MRIVPSPGWLALIVLAPLLAGCSSDEIQTTLVPKASPLPFTYELPKGWAEKGQRTQQQGAISVEILEAFSLEGGGPKDEMTITALKGGIKKLPLVNRWREQVGLSGLKEAPQAGEATVAGIKGDYYDFNGPRKRALVVVVNMDEREWYFKLMADKDVASRNKEAFEQFLKSVKQKGADDE